MAVQHYRAKTFSTSVSIGYLVKLAHTLMHDRASEAFAAHDVSFVQWIALRRIAETGTCTATDLCRAMNHDTGALTRLIDHLEEHGYVERVRSSEDRRVVRLQAKEAGLEKLAELTPVVVALLNEALSDFSKAEFDEFSRLLNKLIAKLKTLGLPDGASS